MNRDGEGKLPRLLDTKVPQTVVPKPIGKAMTHAAIRLKEHRSVRMDKIMEIGMFNQALCKKVTEVLSECVNGNAHHGNNSSTPNCKTKIY